MNKKPTLKSVIFIHLLSHLVRQQTFTVSIIGTNPEAINIKDFVLYANKGRDTWKQ